MTARRDLAILPPRAACAAPMAGRAPRTPATRLVRSRLDQGADQKRRIACALAASVEASQTIFVESSTTSYFVVERLLQPGISATLLTNCLPVMSLVAAAESSNLKLVGLGGSFRALTQSFVGAETVRAIEGFYADRVVFSVKGISDEALTDPDPRERGQARMIGQAATVVLVATGRKFDGRGLNVIARSPRADRLRRRPTDLGTRMLAEAGSRSSAPERGGLRVRDL